MAWALPQPKKEEEKKRIRPIKIRFKRKLKIENLKVGIYGAPGVGKTYFALSAADVAPPVFVIDTEYGAEKVAAAHFSGKDIFIYPVQMIEDGEFSLEKAITNVNQALVDITRFYEKYKVKGGTIVLDSGTDIWGWLGEILDDTAKKTKIGTIQRTEWKTANKEYRKIFAKCIALPANFVITGQEKSVYEGGQETSIKTYAWQKQTAHWVDMVIHAQKINTATSWKFQATLEKFRLNQSIRKTWERVTFRDVVDFITEELKISYTPKSFEITDEILEEFFGSDADENWEQSE